MENNLNKKYGFWTAVAMVIGIVIGSGVFFKAEKVLLASSGNVLLGIFAWIVGGCIMIICAYSFAIMAGKYAKVNGIVDYAEASMGKNYGYIMGWFMAVIYYPVLTAILSWVSAKYTAAIFLNVGDPNTNGQVYLIAIFYIIAVYILNLIAPILAGKMQVSTTFIKLIPLILMAVLGIIRGLYTRQVVENFGNFLESTIANPLLSSIVATAFAYEGWIVATTINSELKDSRKNLPKALLFGSIATVIIYVLYFIGLSGSISVVQLVTEGEAAVSTAFSNVLGSVGGSALYIFVIISCLGTLNGLVLASIRGFYSISIRNMGPSPKFFSKIGKKSKLPVNSGLVGFIVSIFWVIVWYGSLKGWWGMFLDFSELPVITMYALYIPIFIWMMKEMKDLGFIKRYVVPGVSILVSLFMIVATFISHGVKAVLIYIVVFCCVIIIGLFFKNGFSKKESL